MKTSIRYSETRFRRYLPHLCMIADLHPVVVQFSPEGVSPDTFARQLREAVRAQQKMNYIDSHLDWERFRKAAADLCIAVEGEKVLAGPTEAIRKLRTTPTSAAVENTLPKIEVREEGLLPLCQLLASDCFIPPQTFLVRLSSTPPEKLTRLESAYDLVFVPVQGKTNTYLIG